MHHSSISQLVHLQVKVLLNVSLIDRLIDVLGHRESRLFVGMYWPMANLVRGMLSVRYLFLLHSVAMERGIVMIAMAHRYSCCCSCLVVQVCVTVSVCARGRLTLLCLRWRRMRVLRFGDIRVTKTPQRPHAWATRLTSFHHACIPMSIVYIQEIPYPLAFVKSDPSE
jgi:hypothetical protein